ncbi:hypothetical protein A3860_32905 [Niastella vici]|uniref:Uncharacterized protein n=1 Tax=Niastella vici TaxID=1703345 RepID=A0A1V9FQG7_9BACT|nr:hypothetical protein A3860_32905 [Niastella vici]
MPMHGLKVIQIKKNFKSNHLKGFIFWSGGLANFEPVGTGFKGIKRVCKTQWRIDNNRGNQLILSAKMTKNNFEEGKK